MSGPAVWVRGLGFDKASCKVFLESFMVQCIVGAGPWVDMLAFRKGMHGVRWETSAGKPGQMRESCYSSLWAGQEQPFAARALIVCRQAGLSRSS